MALSPVTDLAFELKLIFCVQGVISPILANAYLHYVYDLWVHRWRRTKATGDMIVIRYADDSAPRRREEEVSLCRTNSEQPCCTRDEGGPLGPGLQDQGSNHRKLRRHNGRGGERCGKGGVNPSGVCW
jgi:hypothetical protein